MPRPRSVSGVVSCAPGAGLLLTATVLASAALAGAAVPAAAALSAQAASQPSVVVTSVTPGYAKPGSTVTVSGVVANPAATAVPGVSVQLLTSGALTSAPDMTAYVRSPGLSGLASPAQAASLVQALPSPVPAHGTESWSVRIHPGQLGMSGFAVYPLAVQLTSAAGTATDKTFLPSWPGRHGGRHVKPLDLAWVWPLIDSPHRVGCPALTGNSLAANVAQGGRLNLLLAAGESPAGRQAQLTWAIDPALLSDVEVMTHRYQVAANPVSCTGGRNEPANPAAQSWLTHIRQVAGSQDFFVTPYDNVDVSALVHRGLNNELAAAFTDGQTAAAHVLNRYQNPASPTGMVAWPTSGIADYSVLEGLAGLPSRGVRIRTVVLDSTVMPPSPTLAYTPSAVTSTLDGLGSMNVVLADDGLASLLATPAGQVPGVSPAPVLSASSTVLSQAATLAQAQSFRAETAMIAAQTAPPAPRSVVVTPPQHWHPSAGLADALLGVTTSTPWLHPASLASITVAPTPPGAARLRQSPPPHQINPRELRAPLLNLVRGLYARTSTLEGAISKKGGTSYVSSLSEAVDATESSAWRGGRAVQQRDKQLVRQVSRYVAGQVGAIRIIGPGQVTMGGSSGSVPVSISNDLPEGILVKLEVTGTNVSVGKHVQTVGVPSRTEKTIKIPVRATGSNQATLTLRLLTTSGALLTTASVPVSATHFGTFAIVIIVIALLVFVLTATARAIRPRGAQDEEEEQGSSEDDGEADSVESTGVGTEDSQAAREADDHASTPGRPHRR